MLMRTTRSNQSILKEISPGCSLEGLMLKLKLQYFGHLMWKVDSLEKDPDAGRDWGQEEKAITEDEMAGWHHRLNGQSLRELRESQENALVIANTFFEQHKRKLYTWTSADGQHQNQIDYILYSQRWRTSLQSAKTRLGADCGSDHELLIAKFRLKLKIIGKTTRPFRYNLNRID